MKKFYYSQNEKIEAVKEWQRLQLSGLSRNRAAKKMRMSHPTLYRWEKDIGKLPNPLRPRQAAVQYGSLHVEMRRLQKAIIPIREHEAEYVQMNIQATCRNMPPELRALWKQALCEAAPSTNGGHVSNVSTEKGAK